MCAGEPSGFPSAFNKGWIPNFLQKFGILSSLSKKSKSEIVGGGVLDAPAVNPAFSDGLRRIRNICMGDAGPYK